MVKVDSSNLIITNSKMDLIILIPCFFPCGVSKLRRLFKLMCQNSGGNELNNAVVDLIEELEDLKQELEAYKDMYKHRIDGYHIRELKEYATLTKKEKQHINRCLKNDMMLYNEACKAYDLVQKNLDEIMKLYY